MNDYQKHLEEQSRINAAEQAKIAEKIAAEREAKEREEANREAQIATQIALEERNAQISKEREEVNRKAEEREAEIML